MRTEALRFLAIGATCLAVPSIALAQTQRDTTVVLGERPTIVSVLSIQPDLFAKYPQYRDSLQAQFRRGLEGARPRLVEKGVDLHGVFSFEDTTVVKDDVLHVALGSRFYQVSLTASLRWRDRTWPLPVDFGAGHYIWSPQGPAYVCKGHSENELVYTASFYLLMLRNGTPGDLHNCTLVL